MSFLQSISNFLTSTKRPLPGAVVSTSSQLKKSILSLNRSTAPFQIIDGASEGVDLIAEWKIVNAKWYQIFAKAGLNDVFKIYMKFDLVKKEVRTKDKRFTVEWEAGIPRISLTASGFSGQMHSKEFGAAYAFTEELEYGEVYKYRFDTTEIKGPLQKVITGNGWTYKGIGFGGL
ncbi:MAG: hypothetical protein AAB859_01880 [Patescibacteria group bacterium]